jgi:ubiquinol-cytochrome c reductase iron-sulfur subunit
MRRLGRLLVALIVLLAGRGRRAQRPGPGDEAGAAQREVPADRSAEALVTGLLLVAGACGAAFVVLYVVRPSTQLLGLTLGLGLAALAAALIVAGKRVVPQETVVEERSELVMPEAEEEVPELVREGTEGISRRRLITGAAGVAGLGLGAAAIVPAASLGPDVGGRIDDVRWREGTPVVDEGGKPILADDVTPGGFLTGFPEGANKRELGSPVVIVRVPPAQLRLPPGRKPREWAPEGIVAYSKVCTHAGCAIALYRYPLFPDTQPAPALVCPCHYSTFDPARGAKRTFGPAGRPLPQLPLMIAGDRRLLARGAFSGSIGPAWWSVKRGTA